MEMPPDKFEEIEKLMAWKRHEQPPPDYFRYFSGRVLSRIEQEEAGWVNSWWDWAVGRFETQPVFACAYGVAVAGLLLVGFSVSSALETEASPGIPFSGPWFALSSSVDLNQAGHEAFLPEPSPYFVPSVQSAMSPEPAHYLFSGGQPEFQAAHFTRD